ncbi:MAG: hypothetical protein ABW168_13980 [Sedimenticola sp.]
MDKDLKIKALCEERNGLRLEIIEMQRSMHRTILAFVAVSAATASIYWDADLLTDKNGSRSAVLVALSQFEFFLAVFGLSLVANQNVHGGYLRHTEEMINEILGDKVNMWQLEITPVFLGSKKGVMFWSTGVLTIFLMTLYVTLIYFVHLELRNTPYLVIMSLELVIVLIISSLVSNETERVWHYLNNSVITKHLKKDLTRP